MTHKCILYGTMSCSRCILELAGCSCMVSHNKHMKTWPGLGLISADIKCLWCWNVVCQELKTLCLCGLCNPVVGTTWRLAITSRPKSPSFNRTDKALWCSPWQSKLSCHPVCLTQQRDFRRKQLIKTKTQQGARSLKTRAFTIGDRVVAGKTFDLHCHLGYFSTSLSNSPYRKKLLRLNKLLWNQSLITMQSVELGIWLPKNQPGV